MTTIHPPTDADLARDVLARHHEMPSSSGVIADCDECLCGWPCDAHRAAQAVLALLDRVARLEAALRYIDGYMEDDRLSSLDAFRLIGAEVDQALAAAREALAGEAT